MHLRPIRNKGDYDAALIRIESLWQAEEGTYEHDDLEILSDLVQLYEQRTWTEDFPDPIEALHYYMQQHGKTPQQLSLIVGSPLLAFKVLCKEVPLDLEMIWRICQTWKIPAQCLIKPYRLRPKIEE